VITVRAERPEDYAGIHEVNRLAFGRENEARLVEALRKSEGFIPELSLVALKEDGAVIGHILFDPITVLMKEGSLPALALAPLAVLPEFQRQGIGSALVRKGLEECLREGHKVVVVIGHPDYYPRFGFSSARARGLDVAFPVPDEAFLVLELVPGILNGVPGTVQYPPAFEEV
jgi:putative acetyltransferase